MMILVRAESGGTVLEDFDTSMIPDDPAYWNALGARITAGAVRRQTVVGWLGSSRGAWLMAASIVCAAALGVAVARRLGERDATDRPLAAALAPRDRLARALMTPDSPPLLTTLGMGAATTGDER